MNSEVEALEANKKIIRKLVKKYLADGLDFEDLEQEAKIGFLKGFRTWKEEGGASLSSWTYPFILDALRAATSSFYAERDMLTTSYPVEADGEVVDIIETIPDPGPSPEEQYEAAEETKELNRRLSLLSPEERDLVMSWAHRKLAEKRRGQGHRESAVEIQTRRKVSKLIERMKAMG
jgi:RNA polymerase sigma factor (sigma-70 family)